MPRSTNEQTEGSEGGSFTEGRGRVLGTDGSGQERNQGMAHTCSAEVQQMIVEAGWQKAGSRLSQDVPRECLRVGTMNLRRFLCHGESAVHGDSSHIVGAVCAQLGLDIVALSELGLSCSRLPLVRSELKKSGWHLLLAGEIRPTMTGIMVTESVFAHKAFQWCHPSHRAIVVKFVWHNSPAIWIGSIYGFSKNRFDSAAKGEQEVLLADLQDFLAQHVKKADMVVVMGDFNSVGNFGYDQGDHMESWAVGLGLRHGFRLWQDLHRTEEALYTHRQVIAGGLLSETHIDHIWVSLNLGPHVVSYGATQNPLFMSDHCLVVCDMWKVGPAGAQSARHDRLLRHHVT
jgi:exonuclease III